jgi:hypothetical protein
LPVRHLRTLQVHAGSGGRYLTLEVRRPVVNVELDDGLYSKPFSQFTIFVVDYESKSSDQSKSPIDLADMNGNTTHYPPVSPLLPRPYQIRKLNEPRQPDHLPDPLRPETISLRPSSCLLDDLLSVGQQLTDVV